MTHRERVKNIMHYEPCDRIPLVHFGYWRDTLHKWAEQGHLTREEAEEQRDGNDVDARIAEKIGFDCNWNNLIGGNAQLHPPFESRVVETLPDGSEKVLDGFGVIVLRTPGVTSIPAEYDHLLKDRESWEKHYKPRLQFSPDRINEEKIQRYREQEAHRTVPLGVHCGSLFGFIRNIVGVEGSSYLYADDEELYTEIIDTVGELCFKVTEQLLNSGIQFDFAHFWEDICFKSGPLVIPSVFEEKVGPHYRRITDLVRRHGIDIVSLDCDGKIDALLPIWLENGVNTMFPIEVGTWNASIEPWRAQYGRGLRGVGGMNKTVFAKDRQAVDAEIERLKPLVELGGYIPCPDHRIPPDAEWDNVRYYCERMRQVFG